MSLQVKIQLDQQALMSEIGRTLETWEQNKGRRRTKEQYTRLIEAKNLLNQAKS